MSASSSPREVQVAGRLHAAAHELRACRAAPRLDQRRPAAGARVVAQLVGVRVRARARVRAKARLGLGLGLG